MVKPSGPSSTSRGIAQDTSPQALHELAVAAAIWGMPIVSVDAMRQAFLRDAGAVDGDIVYWSKPADAKLQITTPNASTHYVMISLDVREPMVVEIPPAVGAGLFGSINDAWQVPLLDIGPEGADGGKGGRYLLLPPGHHDVPAAGYIAISRQTHNIYAALRAIPEGSSEAAAQRAIALVKKLRVYPVAKASSPPPSRFIDMAGKLYDGIVRFDESFFASLARMIDSEPALVRDKPILERLATLGIRKGTPYAPNAAIRAVLDRAARDAHSRFVRDAPSHGPAYWPPKQWSTASPIGARTNFTFAEPNGGIDLDARGVTFFLACAPPAKLGKASFYLGTYKDSTGQPLSGDKSYRLHVPPAVPARQFWAVTVYELHTAGFVRDARRIEINSYDPSVKKNPDGSVDLHFATTPAAGLEGNTITIPAGRPWFAFFRFYGPGPEVANKTWQLPDIEAVRGA